MKGVKMRNTLSGVQEIFLFYELKASLLQVKVGENPCLPYADNRGSDRPGLSHSMTVAV